MQGSANAVLAKARAMYGRRLHAPDYQALLNCKSVPEAANYLKAKTVYADAFTGTTPVEMQAQHLELLLQQFVYRQLERICRYESALVRRFYQFNMVRSDIEQILSSAVYLKSPYLKDKGYNAVTPFFKKGSQIDADALFSAESVQEFAKALDDTPYAAIVSPHIHYKENKLDFAGLEMSLHRYYIEQVNGILGSLHKSKREEVELLFQVKVDIQNAEFLYRLKTYYRIQDPEQLLLSIAGTGYFLKEKQLEQLAAAPDTTAFLKILQKTKLGRAVQNLRPDYFEADLQREYHRLCKQILRFSTNPLACIFAYGFLAEHEIQNIIHIAEGIRYGLPGDDIKAFLIDTETSKEGA